jgi:hypothetical protein
MDGNRIVRGGCDDQQQAVRGQQSVGVKNTIPEFAAACGKSGARDPSSGLKSRLSGAFLGKMRSLRQAARVVWYGQRLSTIACVNC